MANEKLKFNLGDGSAQPVPLLTIPGGIGLYRTDVALDLELEVGPGLSAEVGFKKCFVRLGSNGDSFLEALVPGPQDSQPFDLTVRWDNEKGVSFAGGGALQVTLPIRAQLPFAKLNALHIIASPRLQADSKLAIELSADVTGSFLDVIDTSVQRIGIMANFAVSGADPLGAIPFGTTIAFKPPTGAGVNLDVAGILNGGGFLSIDHDKGLYFGTISVELLGIGVTANVLINTRPSFSLLAILSADFRPVGLDIGFGFTINAVGGLLGLNRSADLAALKDGVRTNAIASIMFPPNPVADAPRIFSDLSRFFPVLENQFVVGPMIEMGWGKPTGMMTLSLGLIIQVPDPKFAILGILKVLVPPGIDAAPLRIQVNFAGSIDFAARFLRFDSSLFDSRLLTFALDGDMAARLRWGANANFAVTVGGFSPKYVPASDLDIAGTRRVSINLLPTSDNPRLRIESYYAVTSNTLQHGARIEIYAAAAGFGIRGFLGYDVLVQLSPLYFDASFGGAVAVMAFGEDIMSVGLDVRLQGPVRWQVDGEAKFRYLLIKHNVPVHETFGGGEAPAVPDVMVEERFREQGRNPKNWSATWPGQGQLVVQLVPRLSIAENETLAHPSATLEFNQHTLPLNETLQRFGAAVPAGARFFDIIGMKTKHGSLPALEVLPLKSEFAPAQFFELSNDEKISAPAFRSFKSGVRADGAALVEFTKAVRRDLVYEAHVIDPVAEDAPQSLAKLLLFNVRASEAANLLRGAAIARSSIYKDRVASLPTGAEVKRVTPGYCVVDKATLTPIAGIGVLDNHVTAKRAHADAVALNPSLAGKLLVISENELV
jgi:hypothetical protein